MPFDLDDEELKATRKFYNLEDIKDVKYNFTISKNGYGKEYYEKLMKQRKVEK